MFVNSTFTNRMRNLSSTTITAILLFTLVPLYYGSYQYRIQHPYRNNDDFLSDPTHATLHHRPTEADWIRTWLSTQVISPFNPAPLASYCNKTVWHPNLVLNLENANGGIGNIRGNFLDFLFVAIEVGASIILPGMAVRKEDDLSEVWGSRAVFADYFDEEWFLATMGEHCPGMAIYKPEKGQPLSKAIGEGNWHPRSRRLDEDKSNTRQKLQEQLADWLKHAKGYKKDELNLVNVERRLWDFDTRSLVTPGLRRNFGSLLRINPSIRRLSALIIHTLNTRYALNINIDPHDAVPKHAFFGAHLRTEADAQKAGWLGGGGGANELLNFANQTSAYITQSLHHGLRILYVASGNATDLSRFRTKAAAHHPPLTVTSKLDLLPPPALETLHSLSWDQQALVDYEVLLRCSFFSGIVKSSFAYNVAITRNQWVDDEGRVVDPWRVLHSEVGVAFDDGVSRILGRDGFHERRIPRGMWP